MKPALLLLPLDDRPVNYDYPGCLAASAGLDLLLPPRQMLGNPWRSSDAAGLAAWLEASAPRAEALVVAVDTLAYGGLIPSRTSPDPVAQALDRLALLRRLKERYPEKPIEAFSVVQRISRHDSSEEENPYWADYGSRMFRLSVLEHKAELGEASPEETAARDALRDEIPGAVYNHYRGIRRRNHAVNQTMLDWLAGDVFDYLILPQDDTAEYGWNIAEARALQARIRREGLADRAICYPGADETADLLLARAVCRFTGFTPRVWPRYSSVRSPGVVTSYEDRPVHELLKAHLAPLGGSLAGEPSAANLELFINAPISRQGSGELEWFVEEGLEALRQRHPGQAAQLEALACDPQWLVTQREMASPERSPEEFIRALLATLDAGARPVALADMAYVNGADLILGSLLVRRPEIARLAGYAGWNTAGNTLGCVLAQAVIRAAALAGETHPKREQEQAHLAFLFLRFLEDYFYQAIERSRAYLEDLPDLGYTPQWERIDDLQEVQALEGCIHKRLAEDARVLEQRFVEAGLAKSVAIGTVSLPWQRLFEVGIDIHLELP